MPYSGVAAQAFMHSHDPASVGKSLRLPELAEPSREITPESRFGILDALNLQYNDPEVIEYEENI